MLVSNPTRSWQLSTSWAVVKPFHSSRHIYCSPGGLLSETSSQTCGNTVLCPCSHFHLIQAAARPNYWPHFLFVLHGFNLLCLISNQTRSGFKQSNVGRHFQIMKPKACWLVVLDTRSPPVMPNTSSASHQKHLSPECFKCECNSAQLKR